MRNDPAREAIASTVHRTGLIRVVRVSAKGSDLLKATFVQGLAEQAIRRKVSRTDALKNADRRKYVHCPGSAPPLDE
jgi:hypothetical protein